MALKLGSGTGYVTWDIFEGWEGFFRGYQKNSSNETPKKDIKVLVEWRS